MSKTSAQYMLPRVRLISLFILAFLAAAGCAGRGPLQLSQQPQSGQVVANPGKTPLSDNAAGRPAPAENITPAVLPGENILSERGVPVQIALIHYRGTLQPLGCCSPGPYETDEFVVIQNLSNEPQDIRGWRLVNVTKGYLSFTFPEYFPCVPLHTTGLTPHGDMASQSLATGTLYADYPSPSYSAPKSLEQRMATFDEAASAVVEKEPAKIDWTSCGATEPLDETRMAPMPGQQGQPPLCILYPGQSVLVFTDEIHCKHGGFSFNYGIGNIWNNTSPDTAVLYNAKGEEVSRRSYQVK
jgi:hypothetical protein